MRSTKALLYAIALLLVVAVIGPVQAKSRTARSLEQLNQLDMLRTTNPQLAWHRLNAISTKAKADRYRNIPKHRIDFLYARIASAMNRNRQAVELFLRAFKSDSVQHDNRQYIRTAYLLCEELLIMQDNERAMRYILLALNKSRKEHDLYNLSICTGILSKVYYFNDQPAKAYQAIAQAIDILEKNRNTPTVFAVDKLAILRSVQADYYAQDENHEKALEAATKGLKALEDMTTTQVKASTLDEVNYHYWLASFHSMIATQYQLLGQSAQAQLHADKAVDLINQFKILRIDVYYKLLHYYTNARRFDDAIRLTHFLESSSTETDSVNIFNQAYKGFLASAYEGKGDYPKAYCYLKMYKDITEALNSRARAQSSMELATVYETAEKDAQLQANHFEMKIKNRLIIFLVVGLILLAAITYLVLHNTRIVKQKNHHLFSQLNELSRTNAELEQLRKLAGAPKDKNSQTERGSLFERIERLLHQTQRYTDYTLTRETLAAELSTNRKYLCDAIQDAKRQTFNDYINSLRLEHARNLLYNSGSNPVIEDVYISSGFSNKSTFYRLFRQKYGLTPTELKELVIEKKMSSTE